MSMASAGGRPAVLGRSRRAALSDASGDALFAGAPLGTKAKVTNLETGKSTAVTVADRAPTQGPILDVSPKAAEKLDMKQDGVATVSR